MSVISISITESTEQITKGIPRSIALATSSPATIFYTLDGTTPDSTSNVYISAIQTPTNSSSLTLKVFASNGTDSSPVLTYDYGTVVIGARTFHTTVSGSPSGLTSNAFPFGSNVPNSNTKFTSSSLAGITVNNTFDNTLTEISNGFDENGNPNNFSNESLQNYPIIYSITDSEGRVGNNVGNLPGKVSITMPPAVPETSNKSDKLFNPSALVIFQDEATESPDDPKCLNREFFSLENPEKHDGDLLFSSGLDAPGPTGSFVRSVFNPKDQTVTYSYRDSATNRWIFSKQSYSQKDPEIYNFSAMVLPRNNIGGGVVFAWRPFARRILF